MSKLQNEAKLRFLFGITNTLLPNWLSSPEPHNTELSCDDCKIIGDKHWHYNISHRLSRPSQFLEKLPEILEWPILKKYVRPAPSPYSILQHNERVATLKLTPRNYLRYLQTTLCLLQLFLCNLQKTYQQNIPKMSAPSNLKIRTPFDQQNKTQKWFNKSTVQIFPTWYFRWLILLYIICRNTN